MTLGPVTDSGYDPTGNPRYLGKSEVIDEQAVAQTHHVLSVLDAELEALRHEGFRHTEKWLEAEVEAGTMRMRRGLRSTEDYAFVRGQIAAFEQLARRRQALETKHAQLTRRLVELGGMEDPASAE